MNVDGHCFSNLVIRLFAIQGRENSQKICAGSDLKEKAKIWLDKSNESIQTKWPNTDVDFDRTIALKKRV